MTDARQDRFADGFLDAGIWLLFIALLVQALLAKDLGSSPEVHAFHGMLALAVFWLAWVTLLRSRAQVRTLGAA